MNHADTPALEALADVVHQGFVVVGGSLIAILILFVCVACLLVRVIERQGAAIRATCAEGFERVVARVQETDRTAGEAHMASVRASAQLDQIREKLGLGRGSRPDFSTPPPSRPSRPSAQIMAREGGLDADYPGKKP